MNSKKVTIVLGTYKEPQLISNTIDSLLNQTYYDFSIIIVDDNSPDDFEIIKKTNKIIEGYRDARICYIKNSTILVFHLSLKMV